MSVVSENAIVITAKLDTSDIANGVDRIKQSVNGIKWDFAEAAGLNPRAMTEVGSEAGASFSNAFIKRLVIRDAIYGVIRGMEQVFREVTSGLDQLAGGSGKETWSLWSQIADTIRYVVSSLPALGQSQQSVLNSTLGAIGADEQQRKELAALKENPASLKTSSADLTARLEALQEQAAADKANNARYNYYALKFGEGGESIDGANISNFDLAKRQKQNASDQSYIRELLGIARDNERGTKKAYGSGYLPNTDKSESFMEGEIRKQHEEEDRKATEEAAKAAREKAEADRKAAELSKRKTEQGLSQEEQLLGKSQGGIDRDLNYTEKQLRAQKATGVVSIAGGLYGRNDSAATLVQHAAQQVSLLRSIDENIKEIRAQRSELTLT